MRYTITHLTAFTYDAPISESHMEVRMQPRTETGQTCLAYDLIVEPHCRPQAYRDHLSNRVDHFNVPEAHDRLTITARSQVEVQESHRLPSALDSTAWRTVDEWAAQDAHWDLRHPSAFASWTEALAAYAATIPAIRERSEDPLSTVRTIMTAVHRDFSYVPQSTRVDSPIDEALAARRGVCQDFAHISVALLRRVGLPARYVSGYMAPGDPAGSLGVSPGATHAWVEVLLPALGWHGFDPTNNLEAGVRHIRVAIGRDYADVPPARGVYKGAASSALRVAIDVRSPGAIGELLQPEVSTPMVRAARRHEEAVRQDIQEQQQQ